ncbi:MAG: efflux RND transporter periplasmic adaptor subunit [Planctomycetes bacterium]|nr:efflux RND transporter periplasmic adaptor subunit [Planctomycetota bacterium]
MRFLIGLLALAAVVVGMLFLQGIFASGKVGPGTEVLEPERAGARRTAVVGAETVPLYAEAVGTVRSRRTTRVSPRIMGTILEIKVRVGEPVNENDLLALLDVREAEARLAGARAGLAQAEAVHLRAASELRRVQELFAKNATTREQVEAVTADHDSSKAAADGAREAVKAAEIVVGYAEIRAPMKGVVAEKLAEPGDLALPGKPILSIQDPADLRLEADVREYLIANLEVGAPVEILFGAPLSERFDAAVEERAPEADPGTRTFLVKASLPKESKARPGNFGRLRFRVGEREWVSVAAAAVSRVGQLETVRVAEGDRVTVRHVRTGEARGDRVEVLSGLTAGEKVVVE